MDQWDCNVEATAASPSFAPSANRLEVEASQRRAHKKIAEMRIPRKGVKRLVLSDNC
ncbi:MAG: hypothetical protein JRJ14_08690 [Deltaproteobacteria bacterium]|nr:hypothetical protein [Deltaproteobacteria bacterium]